MYDTVNLWLPLDKAGSFDISKVLHYLSNVTDHQKSNGQVYYTGHLENYKVCISDRGVSFKGSLAKYFLTDNYHTLTRLDSLRAFEMMSDKLSLPIHRASVKRIDFAQNFIMDFVPQTYYCYLGDCQYFRRQPIAKSLYYVNGNRQKLFYNKVAEGKAKGLTLPDVWSGKNILRYELRFTARLTNQFNQAEIKAKILSDEKFYMTVFDKWLNEYEAINKLKSLNLNLESMNSPKDFMKQMALMQIQQIGLPNLLEYVEELRAKKAFEKPEYYSRLKNEIKDLCKIPSQSDSTELITELNKKIKSTERI